MSMPAFGMGLTMSAGMGLTMSGGIGAVGWALTAPMHKPKVVVMNIVRVKLKIAFEFMVSCPVKKKRGCK